MEFENPLDIIKAEVGDRLVFPADEITPYSPTLTIYDMDGTTLYGPAAEDLTRNGVLYWFITVNTTFSATAKTYYEIEIDDSSLTGYTSKRWILYITDEPNFENYITRALGLTGHNARFFSHTWTRGLLTAFQIKIYSTASDVDAAEAGTADDYLAHYSAVLRYDSDYNNYETQITRVS